MFISSGNIQPSPKNWPCPQPTQGFANQATPCVKHLSHKAAVPGMVQPPAAHKLRLNLHVSCPVRRSARWAVQGADRTRRPHGMRNCSGSIATDTVTR